MVCAESFSILPSRYSVTGSFSLGYGMGEGAETAKGAFLETGADTALITGAELWQAEAFAGWPLGRRFCLDLGVVLGPSGFAVVGRDPAGNPVEGRRYSSMNLDAAVLASFEWPVQSGLAYFGLAPFFGFVLAGGQVVLKTDGVTSRYSVPADEMTEASLGGMLRGGYSLPAGLGYLTAGLKITYRYTTVKGFLTDDTVPLHLVTPSVSLGYSLKDVGR